MWAKSLHGVDLKDTGKKEANKVSLDSTLMGVIRGQELMRKWGQKEFFFLIKDTLYFCADYNNHIGGKRDYVGERIALAKYLSR